MSTLVLGIGNTLLSDEGIGVHVTRYLSDHHGPLPDTEFLDGGTLSFTLAASIENADNLIVIDATQLNEAPGSVRAFVGASGGPKWLVLHGLDRVLMPWLLAEARPIHAIGSSIGSWRMSHLRHNVDNR